MKKAYFYFYCSMIILPIMFFLILVAFILIEPMVSSGIITADEEQMSVIRIWIIRVIFTLGLLAMMIIQIYAWKFKKEYQAQSTMDQRILWSLAIAPFIEAFVLVWFLLNCK